MAIEDEPRVDAGDGDRSREVTPWTRRLAPVREFVATENASAAILLAATVAAIVWANSPWSGSYERFWDTEVALRFGSNELALDLRHWVNDGLMAFFFFVVGLEIRRELDMGELRERRRVATPVLAAIGGMVAPALIYLAVNAGESSARGWGIAMGTDTAFAIGILTLVGGAAPRVRSFLLTLVIVDDIVALAVIALAYTDDLSLAALGVAVGLYGVVLVLRASGVRHGVPYFLVGLGMWLATLASGVHATIAGVAVGLLATAYPPSRQQLSQAGTIWRLFREEPTPEYARTASRTLTLTISPNERLQHLFHPWTSYVIVPLFALANAGIVIDGGLLAEASTSPITLGILVGYVLGRPVGFTGGAWLLTRLTHRRLRPPVGWAAVAGGGTIAGIGFTVSLLIATLAFAGPQLEEAKLGILGAALSASVVTWLLFRGTSLLPHRLKIRALQGTAEPLVDLYIEVEPERDHVRGPIDAPVTVVEYGDFECPYCGQAEPVVRELLGDFADVRYVWRHLPLSDVHPRAQLAAEAAEAAAAQGAFWPMHDVLLTHQEALRPADLIAYAEQLGLDVDRFADDLRSDAGASRVAEDVDSADLSGVTGTPTFFVNGRRHYGAYDIETLSRAVRAAGARALVTATVD